MVDNLDEDQNWLYCKDTNTKLLPISISILAKTFISGGDYLHKLDELCNSVGILSDDGDSIVDKHSGFVLRKIDFSSEEGFDEAGFRVTTHDIIEKDIGTVVMEQLQKKEKRVFENETAEVIFNVASTICRNIDIPFESIEDFVMVTSRELFDKAIFSEGAYQKRSDKNLKDKGKALQPYQNYRDETRIVIISSCVMVGIQTAVPSFKTNKSMPGCVRSFSGYPLAGGVEDLSGLQYLACVLEKTKNNETPPWNSIAKYKPEVLTKRMRDIFDNYIMKRSDVNDMYVKKREYMILNPELISPEEHKITKWTYFLPPVLDFTVLKSIRNVASDFESQFKDDLRKGNANQPIAVASGKMLQYGYAIIESINNIVKTKDLILKNSARIPFLENACCNDKIMLTNPISYFNDEDEKISHYIIATQKLAKLAKLARDSVTPSFIYHSEFTGVRYSAVSGNSMDDVEIIYSAIIYYCNFDRNRPIPEKLKAICNEKPANYNPYWTIYEKIEHLKTHANQFNVDHLHQLVSIIHNDNIVTIDKPVPITKVMIMKELIDKLEVSNSNIISEPLRRLLLIVFDKYKAKCMSYEVSNELNDLKNYLLKTNRDLYKEIIEFFGKYGNLSDSKYEQLHSFLSNIERWNMDRPMKESGLYYDQSLYSISQFIRNAVKTLSKTYPSILLNDVGFYKKVHKHWGFSDKHNDIISKFLEQYYEKIEKFKGDSVLLRLLQEIDIRLTDLPIFLENLPFFTEIVKDMGDEVEDDRIRSFYCLFDKESIYLLFSYCFYSAIYEYIVCANDADLLRADIQTIKLTHRSQLREGEIMANSLTSMLGGIDNDLNDSADDINEVEIVTGDLEELKKRVASLLLCFLQVEKENKEALDYTYEQVIQKVKRDKDVEKQGIIERLGNMSIEERKVENDLKNYKIGRWNVGEQKGLYQYDKTTFDREIDEMLLQGEQLEFENTNEMVDADDIMLDPEGEEPDNFYERGAINISDLAENFTDGAYYEEDREYDDEY